MSNGAKRGHTVKSIDEMEAIHGGIVKLAGAEVGISSFGMQVFDFPADFSAYPEHDHSEDGQEEVYAVLEGSAEFEVDGERVSIDRGRLLRVAPGVKRKLLPGAGPVRILAIGCTTAGPYERPADFRSAGAS